MIALYISYSDLKIYFIKKQNLSQDWGVKSSTNESLFNNIDFVLRKKQNFVRSTFFIVKKSVFFTRTRIHLSFYRVRCLL